ncbi:MAG: Fic family protein [Lactobacillus sp.]|jgi:cell filamentation protein|nr:Fic family protein [Lactobacillus sp.]
MADWIKDTLQPNGTLKNKWGISDANKLKAIEFKLVALRLSSLPQYPITNIDALKKIHAYLFSELYDWAGTYRNGDFGKGHTTFHPRRRFDMAILDLNSQIKHINDTHYHSDKVLALDLARLLLDINMFHPFREGNGRAQRAFIVMLASQKGKHLVLARSGPTYRAYMSASIKDNTESMAKLLYQAML